MAMLLLSRVYAPADPEETFTGKTVIVTGSNTGLGFEAAAKFIEKDAAKVILGVRTTTKGEAAKKAIVDRYGHQDRVEVWELDMTNYDSIKKFAEKANQLSRLDIALLNAGVYMTEYKSSSYSWEETLQVNTISTTLLGILLLPKLKQSKTPESTPVLEFTNSGTHLRVNTAAFSKDNTLSYLSDKQNFSPSLLYGSSKLLLMFVLQELADQVNSSTTLVTSVCPGACRSDLARGYDNFFMRNIAKPAIYAIFRTQEQGARTLVSGTTLGEKGHGRFWQHDKIQPKIALLENENSKKLQEKIWSEIIDAIKKDYPDVEAAIKQISA